jgi:translation initiation factor IF-3
MSITKRERRPTEKYRINKRIRISPILVIRDGDKLGVMDTKAALAIAEEAGLDLVEVSPNVRPPVCKILDYGKFKYDEKKKLKEQKANQTTVQTKEIKFRPKTEGHDKDFKSKHVRRFIEAGNRCVLVVQFRGRERAHPRVGEALLLEVAETLSDIAEITNRPAMEGGRMVMLLSPKAV